MPEDLISQADFDIPLPIGHGQTISQPSTVKQMLSWLDVQKGQTVLDIGSGSGWTTALLAYLVGEKGKVFAVERIPELLVFGEDNCHKLGLKNTYFYPAGKELGLPRYGPYDRILVSAAAEKFPDELMEQLKIGGKMVVPVGNEILEITKISGKKRIVFLHAGFVFVPLV